jgi:putative DNA primase/helicase
MGGGVHASEGALERADELVRYLQLALGYSITGETREKAIFVPYGSGDNGKTTLLSVVRDLIREYAATVGLDLLTTKEDSNNVAAARAKLLGARFVSTSETEEGQRLSAARLKRICQGPGGEIEACRKYENPITFRETGKLWLDANHKPERPATDAAVWSRVHLIPFTVTIPKGDQDHQLRDKLLAEAEGILAWLVEGAVCWYANGLPPSKIVSEATNAWKEEVNRLRAFLDENTEAAQEHIPNKNLFASYKQWCEENNERYVLSQQKFTDQMEAMGHKRERKEQGYVWLGIRFRRL